MSKFNKGDRVYVDNLDMFNIGKPINSYYTIMGVRITDGCIRIRINTEPIPTFISSYSSHLDKVMTIQELRSMKINKLKSLIIYGEKI